VSEAGRPREQVENYGPKEQVENNGRACVLRSFSYVKQSWDFFHFLEIVTGWLVTFHLRRSRLLKTKQVS
jgi:hypothetical protein